MTDRFSGAVFGPVEGPENKRPTMGEIGLNNFAPYLMNRVIARWNANLADDLKALDITTAKMRALAILSITPSVTINELSVFAVTEQSTMSRTLESLEEQGFIRRQPRPDDMRVRDVTITEEGRAAFEKIWPTMYDDFLKMFEGIEEEEYKTFIGVLHRILRNIRQNDI
ncbi:MarR family winged helix-turn-helix transcriptional regulator [Rhizobium sp. G21]|uniref:MarR family winged helix-turn-helix transcriptional regulator n=1 Tax=Rhizobium sp. G21 TaxID=2758439 RepID=UPI001600BBE3|nr:MarR family transcriptional regulator [Rhizobium sp. G21]MBB1251287.1 MarR family transcriptional regulator [Rhizobium sp. G21]